MWSVETVLAALAYQTHGEGWRLGTEADVDLHIQCWASGACVHRCVCQQEKKCNGLHECERGMGGAESGQSEIERGQNLNQRKCFSVSDLTSHTYFTPRKLINGFAAPLFFGMRLA